MVFMEAKKIKVRKFLRQYGHLYVFVMPAVIFLIVFKYLPLYNLQIAFKDYRITRPLSQAEWAGFKYFKMLFSSPGFTEALVNTVKISFYKILLGFPAPIILALLLNEVRNAKFKKITQTVIYLPHFISWIVVGGIAYNMFSPSGGMVNQLIGLFGIEPIYFLGENKYFVASLVLSDIWKEAGWGTIVYLATLSQIDPTQYEAAGVDGANRFQRMIYITMPALKDVIVVLLIMRLGQALTVGFEQIMAIGNPLSIPGRHVLETYTYNMGLLNFNYPLATAAGLFLSIVAAVMVYGSDRVAKLLGGKGLI